MTIGTELKRRAQSMLAPAIFLSLVGYFSWNAIQGAHGLKEFSRRQELLKTANAELARAEAERDAWEKRVAGLRSNHIDRDTLDERARAMLNMADPSDVVVQYGPKERLTPNP